MVLRVSFGCFLALEEFFISANSISFKVTDSGEVTLNVAQADKLDGRFTGGLLIKDTSSAINS